MSFILDALRKSDARRRQGGPPGLNSPEPASPSRRRRRSGWLALAGIAVVAVAVGAGVAVLRPQWLPPQIAGLIDESGTEPATEAAAPAQVAVLPDDDEATTRQQSSADDIRARMTRGEAVARTQPAAPEAVANDDSPDEQAKPPVVDRRQPRGASPERSVSRQAPQRESVPVPPDEGLEELERRLARERQRAQQRGDDDARSRGADGGPADRARRSADEASRRTAQQPADAQDKQRPEPLSDGVAEYVRQWELPLSVRRNLPDMKLNIHVFSPREAERFVLVNGERYVAGDFLANGVRLVDIRREGAIVDFRSHRFLLEPK